MSETLSRFAVLVSAAAERRFLKKRVASKPAARAVYDHFHPENMPKENTP